MSGEPPSDPRMVLEALLLAAETPPTVSELAEAACLPPEAVESALAAMEGDATRGIRLRRHGATVALVSAPEAAPWVERLLRLETPNRLSRAALETVALIAYHQPVSRDRIEQIRGVRADHILRTLRARGLIEPTGRLDTPGQPLLWGVTASFLDHFGLSALSQLPPLPALDNAEPGPRPAEQASLLLEDDQGEGK